MSFLKELRRRSVFQVGAAYAAVAWLAVEAASIGFPAFEAPAWLLRFFILVALLGFPIALVLAWAFEFTPAGPRLDSWSRGSKRLVAIATLLAVIAVFWYLHGQIERSSAVVPAHMPTAEIDPAGPSIAVLPFVNMTSDREQDYFSDGLSEELLNMLAQVPKLRVIARTSSFSFKGKDADIAAIAQSLRVAHVLEGSVRKSGATLRITAQLIRSSDSSHLWSQTYDRKLDDLFKVQDEIAAAVVDSLLIKLLPEQHLANARRSSNIDAYNEYLRGNHELARATREGYENAVAAYGKAIALDPAYAAAQAGLAVAEIYASDYSTDLAASIAAKQRATEAADRAIRLAPDLADGYATRGWIRSNVNWDWPGALTDFEKAQALDPQDTTAKRRYGQLLASTGRLKDAITEIRKASDLDPLASAVWGNLGYYLTADGQYKEAKQALEHALALNPESSISQWNLAQTALLDGDAGSALGMFQRSADGYRQTGIALSEHTLGRAAESRNALDDLIAHHAADWAMQIAEVFAWRGEIDDSLAWLERAYLQHDGGLSDIGFDPLLANLRKDPRFHALVRKLKLN